MSLNLQSVISSILSSVPEVAGKPGPAWADWLAGHCPELMAPEVYQVLGAGGIYSLSGKEQDSIQLREYAASWNGEHLARALTNHLEVVKENTPDKRTSILPRLN